MFGPYTSFIVFLCVILALLILWIIFFGPSDKETSTMMEQNLAVKVDELEIEVSTNDLDTTRVTKPDESYLSICPDTELPEIIVNEGGVDNTPSLPEKFRTKEIPEKQGRFTSKGETICRKTMEKIYGVKFDKKRPKFLRNPKTGKCLELDCYNEDLQIAVEYNGVQHYKYPNFFHKTKDSFIEQVRRDMLKADLCDKYGIYLITVPYNVPYEMIPHYIISQLPDSVQSRINTELFDNIE
jgi:hypothetical protein